MNRPLIFICSPYRGDVKTNTQNARRYCRFVIAHRANRISPGVPGLRTPFGRVLTPPALASLGLHEHGGIPFAPHLLFTQFLNDGDPMERRVGLCLGIEMLKRCDELWAFGQPTEGMTMEIREAEQRDVRVRRFDTCCREVTADE